ncbi:MAG TPA: hypothetical protein ENI73_07805 [Spirochaetes bacterium]|nr:hypothetical protein [Spirochaetota bacterium]
MSRKLDPKLIKARIKENKIIMKANKYVVSAQMALATKNKGFDPFIARTALSDFLRAAVSFGKDADKLAQIVEGDDNAS